MFKYRLNNFKLFGYHGVYEVEKRDGQYFYFDILYSVSYEKNISDDVLRVIDYSKVCDDIKYVFIKKRYNLMESLLIDISKFLKQKYPKITFEITITKKNKFNKENAENTSVTI